MNRPVKAVLGAVALVLSAVLGVAALATSAAAESYPESGWQLRDAHGTYPDVSWQPAELSAVESATTVLLSKPSGDVGTSAEAANLGVPVSAGDEITVGYSAINGAVPDAGAIRLFWYDVPDADTLNDAPTGFVAAGAELSGTLTIVVEADATVGTIGLTYDASNDSAGTVVFANLTVAGEPISFEAPPASPEPSISASPTPTATPATEPSDQPTAEPAALPDTGTGNGPLVLAVLAVILFGAGGLLVAAAVISKRREERST